MTYAEKEAALTAAAADASPGEAKIRALAALAEFHAFCGKNLWCFEFNREPERSCAVLPLKDWDEFDAFFKTVPEGLEYPAALSKATAAYRDAVAAAAAAGLRAEEGRLLLEGAGTADLAGDDAGVQDAYARAEAIFTALGDDEKLGDIAMGRAHEARYRTYDMAACRRLLADARARFDRAGCVRGAAHAAFRLAETYDPALNGAKTADLDRLETGYREASDLFAKAGDLESAANALAAPTRVFKEAGLADRELGAFVRCLDFIERNFRGEDLAGNYEVAARFYEGRGLQDLADAYRAKAAAARAA